MRISFYIFSVTIFLLNACYGFCGGYTSDNVIATGLDNMYLVHTSMYGSEDFCNSMLGDIKLNNYTIVEPIISTDSYQDPSLNVCVDKCSNLKLNKYNIIGSSSQYEYAMTLPEEEREEVGKQIYMTKDFRLYHIDLDNDPKNGKEHVFYGAGEFYYYGDDKQFINTASFQVIDFSSCKKKGRFGSTIEQDENTREGIIKYAGEYYIYSSKYHYKDGPFYLSIGKWVKVGLKDEEDRSYSPVCLFSVNRLQ